MSKTPEVWDLADAEYLAGYETLEEAVEGAVRKIEERGERVPSNLEMAGFVRMEATMPGHVLENLLEELDEEYASESSDPSKPTEAMKAAEKAFLDAVKAEYIVWQFEDVSKVTVNLYKMGYRRGPGGKGIRR